MCKDLSDFGEGQIVIALMTWLEHFRKTAGLEGFPGMQSLVPAKSHLRKDSWRTGDRVMGA